MELLHPEDSDLDALLGWFEDEASARRWGGPRIRWPLLRERFAQDIYVDYVHTRVVRGRSGELVAFGQFYRKFERCHLARIAVAPASRGAGLGTRLVRGLMRAGMRHLGLRACSLYVLGDNAPAVACYRACGFSFAEDPEPVPAIPDCLFMVAEGEPALAVLEGAAAGDPVP